MQVAQQIAQPVLPLPVHPAEPAANPAAPPGFSALPPGMQPDVKAVQNSVLVVPPQQVAVLAPVPGLAPSTMAQAAPQLQIARAAAAQAGPPPGQPHGLPSLPSLPSTILGIHTDYMYTHGPTWS